MKKTIIAFGVFILSVFSFNLMADNENSVTIDFGKDFSTTKYKTESGETYKAKSNLDFGITYLRTLDVNDGALSVGLNYEMRNAKTEKINTATKENTLYGGPTVGLFIVDYAFIKTPEFTTSVEMGAGLGYRYMKSVDISGDSKTKGYVVLVPAVKIGINAYYNVAEHFAIGATVDYTYAGANNFKVDDQKIKANSSGNLSTNLGLRFMF